MRPIVLLPWWLALPLWIVLLGLVCAAATVVLALVLVALAAGAVVFAGRHLVAAARR